ncbi:MAG: CPBP family intramembrane metalloprotease [Salibacteraceae bacterium]|nr:CPBP family intramembrane metalloprotease [Salibacteraceae bacterium]
MDLIINLLVIAVFPAISEELFFRGFLQNTLLKMGRNHHVAIWVTAFIFSAIHMQFLGFFPRLILGAVLGYSAMYSRSLIVPIIGHFVNNGLAVVLTYYIGMEMMDTPESLGALSSSELALGAASAVALGLGMWVMRKRAVPIE